MDISEIKWLAGFLIAFMLVLFGALGFSEYLAHKREVACIEKGGTPANKTCLFGVKGQP